MGDKMQLLKGFWLDNYKILIVDDKKALRETTDGAYKHFQMLYDKQDGINNIRDFMTASGRLGLKLKVTKKALDKRSFYNAERYPLVNNQVETASTSLNQYESSLPTTVDQLKAFWLDNYIVISHSEWMRDYERITSKMVFDHYLNTSIYGNSKKLNDTAKFIRASKLLDIRLRTISGTGGLLYYNVKRKKPENKHVVENGNVVDDGEPSLSQNSLVLPPSNYDYNTEYTSPNIQDADEARPLSLLTLNIGSPYGRQNQQLQGIVPVAPWQNNALSQLPWQNNASAVNFPVPPSNSNGILGANPNLPPPTNRPVVGNSQNRSVVGNSQNRPVVGNSQGTPPWQQNQLNQKPPGLLDGVGGSQSGMQPLMYDSGSRNANNSNRFQGNMDTQRSSNSSQSPQRNNTLSTSSSELEKRAFETAVSKEFYERIQPIANAKKLETVALDFARIEYLRVRGLGAPSANPSGIGHHVCALCNIRYLTRDQLNLHNMTPNHKELDGIFNLKKEQARLIRENKILHPDVKHQPIQSSQPDATMVAVSRAEVEMKLEPTHMELDPYILGIYESIMKPYWPVPKSTYYCRICNYVEFRAQSELDRHNLTREHKKREDTYAEAFCLYCQVHNVDSSIMSNHEKTEKHRKAKELMGSTKRCAITHWHKVNRIPLPIKYTQEWASEDKAKDDAKVGAKRSAPSVPDQKMISPAKKVTTSMSHGARTGQNADTRKPVTVDLTKPSVTKKGRSPDRINHALSDKNTMWFAPINGHMCVACHVFIPNGTEQTAHLKEALHAINVAKFKKMLMN